MILKIFAQSQIAILIAATPEELAFLIQKQSEG
jgi:hypothetical protein